MKFLQNNDRQNIITALLSGQKTIMINHIEIFLKPLKTDTRYRKEQAAEKQAIEILKIL